MEDVTKVMVIVELVKMTSTITEALNQFVNPDNALDLPDDLRDALSALAHQNVRVAELSQQYIEGLA